MTTFLVTNSNGNAVSVGEAINSVVALHAAAASGNLDFRDLTVEEIDLSVAIPESKGF